MRRTFIVKNANRICFAIAAMGFVAIETHYWWMRLA